MHTHKLINECSPIRHSMRTNHFQDSHVLHAIISMFCAYIRIFLLRNATRKTSLIYLIFLETKDNVRRSLKQRIRGDVKKIWRHCVLNLITR